MSRLRSSLAIAVWAGSCLNPGCGAGEPAQSDVDQGIVTAAGGGGSAVSGAAAASAGSAALGGAAAASAAGGGAGDAASAPVAGTAGEAGSGGQAAGGSTAAGQGGSSGAAPPPDAGTTAPSLPAVTSVDADGPFETAQDLASGPRGESGLFHPAQLGQDGLLHPVFVWGCGGGSSPSSYAQHLRRIASHGFVVIAEVSMIGDDGDVLSASLDWILAENERPESALFGKLDAAKVAAGGHSIGSVNTFLWADDPRLLTTIHVAGGSLDDVNDPFAPTTGLGGKGLVHPAAFICSETDAFGNVEKTEADYAATTVPVFFTVMTGSDHVAAARDGLPAIVAWLRWQLGGESERRSMFLDPMGEFQSGKYVTQIKNW